MSPYSFNLAARNPPFVGAKQMVSRKLRLLGLTETNLDELCKLATSPLLYQAERWRRKKNRSEQKTAGRGWIRAIKSTSLEYYTPSTLPPSPHPTQPPLSEPASSPVTSVRDSNTHDKVYMALWDHLEKPVYHQAQHHARSNYLSSGIYHWCAHLWFSTTAITTI